jgi:hypothetical protein
LSEIGGASLLNSKYKASPSLLLSTVYPDYDWLPWKFAKSAQNYWNDMKNQRKFLDWAAKQLKIKEMSDWLKVTTHVLLEY